MLRKALLGVKLSNALVTVVMLSHGLVLLQVLFTTEHPPAAATQKWELLLPGLCKIRLGQLGRLLPAVLRPSHKKKNNVVGIFQKPPIFNDVKGVRQGRTNCGLREL